MSAIRTPDAVVICPHCHCDPKMVCGDEASNPGKIPRCQYGLTEDPGETKPVIRDLETTSDGIDYRRKPVLPIAGTIVERVLRVERIALQTIERHPNGEIVLKSESLESLPDWAREFLENRR